MQGWQYAANRRQRNIEVIVGISKEKREKIKLGWKKKTTSRGKWTIKNWPSSVAEDKSLQLAPFNRIPPIQKENQGHLQEITNKLAT